MDTRKEGHRTHQTVFRSHRLARQTQSAGASNKTASCLFRPKRYPCLSKHRKQTSGATNRRLIVLSVDFACAHAASELEAQQEAAESATAKTLADAVEVARADAVAALTAQAQAEARSEVAEMLAKQQVRTIVLLAGTAVSELHADGSFIVCLFLLC